jgi:hypothetical protein
MRSPSEPEPRDSKEHALLDSVEAGLFSPNERYARGRLLEESEKNMRSGAFSELYPRRSRNMQLLFDLMRSGTTPRRDDGYLEVRLLRLMDKHDQCRQLCQSVPMYDWTFGMLQEFVWASRGDSFPYPRYTGFPTKEDAMAAHQLYTAARTLHESKCYQWQQAHDAAARPTADERKLSKRNDIGMWLTLGATGVAWYFFGWLPSFAAMTIGFWLNYIVMGDSGEAIKRRMAEWVYQNPRPPNMCLTLEHRPEDRPPPPWTGYPDLPA